jgi:hypothetical protein
MYQEMARAGFAGEMAQTGRDSSIGNGSRSRAAQKSNNGITFTT